ncbi:hypothetical protein N665_0597s0005 [Sinapis alba]|nr:hypothetical protein N665_0597s0005 [Sinapis alba]
MNRRNVWSREVGIRVLVYFRLLAGNPRGEVETLVVVVVVRAESYETKGEKERDDALDCHQKRRRFTPSMAFLRLSLPLAISHSLFPQTLVSSTVILFSSSSSV